MPIKVISTVACMHIHSMEESCIRTGRKTPTIKTRKAYIPTWKGNIAIETDKTPENHVCKKTNTNKTISIK